MALPPAVMIHSLADARAALAPVRPVTLLSGPGAALYAGCAWWAKLLAAADARAPSLLDCGDAPGRALEALRLGLPGLVLAAEPGIFSAVAQIAEKQGALLLPRAPPALDFAQRGARRRLAEWLDDTG